MKDYGSCSQMTPSCKSPILEFITFYQNALRLTRVHCVTFYQSTLCHELHEVVTPSSRVDSSERGLIVVMFCSDLAIERCKMWRRSCLTSLFVYMIQCTKCTKYRIQTSPKRWIWRTTTRSRERHHTTWHRSTNRRFWSFHSPWPFTEQFGTDSSWTY